MRRIAEHAHIHRRMKLCVASGRSASGSRGRSRSSSPALPRAPQRPAAVCGTRMRCNRQQRAAAHSISDKTVHQGLCTTRCRHACSPKRPWKVRAGPANHSTSVVCYQEHAAAGKPCYAFPRIRLQNIPGPKMPYIFLLVFSTPQSARMHLRRALFLPRSALSTALASARSQTCCGRVSGRSCMPKSSA